VLAFGNHHVSSTQAIVCKLTTSFFASRETSSLNLFRHTRASRKAVTPSSLRVKLRTAILRHENKKDRKRIKH
jgi:hypothetical protein